MRAESESEESRGILRSCNYHLLLETKLNRFSLVPYSSLSISWLNFTTFTSYMWEKAEGANLKSLGEFTGAEVA